MMLAPRRGLEYHQSHSTPIHPLQHVPRIVPPAVEARHGGLPGLDASVVGLGVTGGEEFAGRGIHAGDGAGGVAVGRMHRGA